VEHAGELILHSDILFKSIPRVNVGDHVLPTYHQGAVVVSDFYEHPDLYDALLPVGAHLPFYSDLARRQGGAVLELACGTGQLSIPIAAVGLPVVGLDRSTAMLNKARERARHAGVSIELVEGDMRDFNLAGRFALIFIARNSLLHLRSTDDVLSVFAGVRRHLAPNGIFAFDVFNPDVRILSRPSGQRFPVTELNTDAFGPLRVESSHDYDAAAQVDNGTWYISASDEPDKWVVGMSVRSIFPQELPLLVSAAGLQLIDRFGDVSRQSFGLGSPRQVCVCRAANAAADA
jgi:SAM-dependent methyltransferase